MTVANTPRIAGPYLGNGSTTSFPFAFKVFATSDLELTLTDSDGDATVLTLDSDYSITLNADQDSNPGGTITYPLTGSAMASGNTLAGVGVLEALQGTDLTNLGRFLPQTIENALDWLTILVQQLKEQQGRSLRAPAGDAASMELPAAVDRLDRMLGFNATTGAAEVTAFTMTQVASLVAALYAASSGPLDALTFLQAGAGAVGRSAQDKARERVTPEDFGAGEAETPSVNDAAFADLEAEFTGRLIDLRGKTYPVTVEPTGNRYVDGYLNVAGSIVQHSLDPDVNGCWNGNFDVWSRRTTFTTFTSRSPTADGWTFARTGFAAGATVSQRAGSRGSNLCKRVQRDSGNTSTAQMTSVFNMGQSDSRRYIGRRTLQTVRMRAGADFSAASGQVTVQTKSTDSLSEQAITAANGTYGTGDTTAGQTVAVLVPGGDWTYVDVPATIGSTMKQVAQRITWAPTGTAGPDDWIDIEEVKFANGNTRTEFRPIDKAFAELKAAEQCWKTYDILVNAGALTYIGSMATRARGTEAVSALSVDVTFPVRMRAIPTITIYSPVTGDSGKMHNAGAATDLAATALQTGTRGTTITNNAAATSGSVYYFHVVAECPL